MKQMIFFQWLKKMSDRKQIIATGSSNWAKYIQSIKKSDKANKFIEKHRIEEEDRAAAVGFAAVTFLLQYTKRLIALVVFFVLIIAFDWICSIILLVADYQSPTPTEQAAALGVGGFTFAIAIIFCAIVGSFIVLFKDQVRASYAIYHRLDIKSSPGTTSLLPLDDGGGYEDISSSPDSL